MPKKKIVHTRKEIRGKDRQIRFESAYSDWMGAMKKGKTYTLQQLADKHNLHLNDLSRYITMKLEMARTKNKQ